MLNKKDKAQKQRFESICNFVFMHATNEHQPECKRRHLLLPFDVLSEESNPISNGQLRCNVLKILSPTEYVVQPTAKLTDKWHIINDSDKFDELNAQMQAHYKEKTNRIVLNSLEMGEKCAIELHEIFYRGEIIGIIEKRYVFCVLISVCM